MSAVMIARLVGDNYVCARCTAHMCVLIPPGQSDRPGVLVTDSWKLAPPNDRDPGLTILALRRSARRKRTTLDRGRIPDREKFGYPLPILMPCRRPTCGQVNRLESLDDVSDRTV